MQVKGKVRQRFTKEEDQMILLLVKQLGENSWDEVAKQLHNRTKRQCRERWLYHLNPKINSTPWTKEEDELLLRLHKEFGSNWTVMSKYFNRRPNCSLKNRFFVLNYKEGRIEDLLSCSSSNSSTRKPNGQISKSQSMVQACPINTSAYKTTTITNVQSFDGPNFPLNNCYCTDMMQPQIPQYTMAPIPQNPLPLPPVHPPKLRAAYCSSSTPSEPASLEEIDNINNKDLTKNQNKANGIGMNPPSINILSIQSLLV